jgi:hypothetical protein
MVKPRDQSRFKAIEASTCVDLINGSSSAMFGICRACWHIARVRFGDDAQARRSNKLKKLPMNHIPNWNKKKGLLLLS